MRRSPTPPTLLSLLFAVLSHTPTITANPFPIDRLHDLGFGYLQERACFNYCGVDRFCCSDAASAACSTDSSNVAYCAAGPTGAVAAAGRDVNSGSYQVYTTLITMTDLVVRTSIYTSWDPNSYVATTTITGYPPPSCATGQPVCGSICCASSQTCAYENQCAARSAGASDDSAIPFSAPLLVTGGASTATTTSGTATSNPTAASATSTGTGTAVAVAGDGGGGLSGGAIAGIVIGVLAGLILLLLICFCCCLRGAWHTLAGILGFRKKDNRRKRTETIETTERYSSRHSGAHSGAASRKEHKSWFGKASRPGEKKKKGSGLGGFGAVGAGLLGLAVLLGLKRKDDEKKTKNNRPPRPPPSDYSSTYYSDTYTGTSASSESSDDRRTRTRRASRTR